MEQVPSTETTGPVAQAKRGRDVQGAVLIALALGCLLGITRAYATGFTEVLNMQELLDAQAFSMVCSITRIFTLLALTIMGYIGFYSINRKGVLCAGFLLALSVVLLAVPNTVAAIFSAVFAGIATGLLMLALMLIMIAQNIPRIISISLLALVVTAVVIMATMQLPGLAALAVLLLTSFIASDVMLFADPTMASCKPDGDISARRWSTFPWLAALLFLVSGVLGSILYGIASTIDWGGARITNVPMLAGCVVAVVFTTALIMGKTKNWISTVWLPLFMLFLAGLVVSCVAYVPLSEVCVALLLASVFSYHFMRWMVFPALVHVSEMPRVLTAGVILLLSNSFLNVNLGEALALLLPASPSTITAVAAIMSLLLLAVFVLAFVLGGRSHPGFSSELPETVLPEVAQAADQAEEAAAQSVEERCAKLAEEFDLTPREAEIGLLTAKGYSSTYIAEKLIISSSTVRFHQQNIYRKFNIHNRQEFLDLVN